MQDILIVEDGHSERERLAKLFSAAGYGVGSCESVKEAEDLLRTARFRLAILDIGLNDKSGSYLFNSIKSGGRVSYVIIFTGNPSVHLKQRFIKEGAVDYIVKGSPQAQSDQLMARVREIIGDAQNSANEGVDLQEFLTQFIPARWHNLFFDDANQFPVCTGCSGRSYLVSFVQQTQMPPEVKGVVVCASCGKPMDPELS